MGVADKAKQIAATKIESSYNCSTQKVTYKVAKQTLI